jgi:hypothetical protein
VRSRPAPYSRSDWVVVLWARSEYATRFLGVVSPIGCAGVIFPWFAPPKGASRAPERPVNGASARFWGSESAFQRPKSQSNRAPLTIGSACGIPCSSASSAGGGRVAKRGIEAQPVNAGLGGSARPHPAWLPGDLDPEAFPVLPAVLPPVVDPVHQVEHLREAEVLPLQEGQEAGAYSQ